MTDLKAPFPWYGGKTRIAEHVWERFGDPDVYVEPFAGSLAVLLARPTPPGVREVVCDTDGGICNFWRAVTHDPDTVAEHAIYPTIHQDLTARHRHLRDWIVGHSDRLSQDPHYYDAEIAGWWVWGICRWIGGGWCRREDDGRPLVQSDKSNRGINLAPGPKDQIPHYSTFPGSRGIYYQPALSDRRPWASPRGWGVGVNVSGPGARNHRPFIPDHPARQGVAYDKREHVLDWMERLRDRLADVIVLNRDWRSAVTPTILMQAKGSPEVSTAVFLDPPYVTEERHGDLYHSDRDGISDDVAHDAYTWAVEHGHDLRIAYCSHKGDFDVPAGWSEIESSLPGIKRPDRQHRRDSIMFSPACDDDMLPLFSAAAESQSSNEEAA